MEEIQLIAIWSIVPALIGAAAGIGPENTAEKLPARLCSLAYRPAKAIVTVLRSSLFLTGICLFLVSLIFFIYNVSMAELASELPALSAVAPHYSVAAFVGGYSSARLFYYLERYVEMVEEDDEIELPEKKLSELAKEHVVATSKSLCDLGESARRRIRRTINKGAESIGSDTAPNENPESDTHKETETLTYSDD